MAVLLTYPTIECVLHHHICCFQCKPFHLL